MFDKQAYIKSDAWVDNPYLVQPNTAVKQCINCGGLKYSSEFTEASEFPDGKTPVCIPCSQTDSGKQVIDGYNFTRVCKQTKKHGCGQELPLVVFLARGELAVHCKDCRK